MHRPRCEELAVGTMVERFWTVCMDAGNGCNG